MVAPLLNLMSTITNQHFAAVQYVKRHGPKAIDILYLTLNTRVPQAIETVSISSICSSLHAYLVGAFAWLLA